MSSFCNKESFILKLKLKRLLSDFLERSCSHFTFADYYYYYECSNLDIWNFFPSSPLFLILKNLKIPLESRLDVTYHVLCSEYWPKTRRILIMVYLWSGRRFVSARYNLHLSFYSYMQNETQPMKPFLQD